MKDDEKSMTEAVKKFDFSKLDFDVLRERERQEAARRRAEMERIRREEEEAAEAPPPVIFSEEEHNKAVAETFDKGREEGLRQAALEDNRQILELMKSIVPRIEELCDKEDMRKKMFEEQAVKMAVAIAKKVMPALMKKEAANEIYAFIEDAVKKNTNAGVLRIIVPASLKDVIRERLDIMFDDKKYTVRTEIVGDDGMHQQTCRVEWSETGGIEMNPEVLLDKIESITGCLFSDTKQTDKDNTSEEITSREKCDE